MSGDGDSFRLSYDDVSSQSGLRGGKSYIREFGEERRMGFRKRKTIVYDYSAIDIGMGEDEATFHRGNRHMDCVYRLRMALCFEFITLLLNRTRRILKNG